MSGVCHSLKVSKKGIVVDSFVVFDIELANPDPRSICEFAFIKFKGSGEDPNAVATLVKPIGDLAQVDPISQSIHGISSKDLDDAPALEEVWSQVVEFIGDLPLVAHGATQDIKKLIETLHWNYYQGAEGMEISDREFFCTLTIGRNHPETKGFDSHGLGAFSAEYGVEWTQSVRPSGGYGHIALMDAYATGEIMQKMLSYFGGSFSTLTEELNMRSGKIASNTVVHGNTKKPKPNPFFANMKEVNSADFDSMVKDYETQGLIDKSHLFSGRNFLLTLSMQSISNRDFWKCVAMSGGQMKTGISKKIDYLVEGIDPNGKYEKGTSSKSVKARELNDTGDSNIVILDEAGFLELLGPEIPERLARLS